MTKVNRQKMFGEQDFSIKFAKFIRREREWDERGCPNMPFFHHHKRLLLKTLFRFLENIKERNKEVEKYIEVV